MNCPHCNNPLDEHEAGRETDVCVAVAVMGWRRSDQGPPDPENWQSYPDEWYERPDSSIVENVTNVPEYSASDGIAAAWEAIEKLGYYRLGSYSKKDPNQYENVPVYHWVQFNDIVMEADTVPLAICRAALKAVAVFQERKVTA